MKDFFGCAVLLLVVVVVLAVGFGAGYLDYVGASTLGWWPWATIVVGVFVGLFALVGVGVVAYVALQLADQARASR